MIEPNILSFESPKAWREWLSKNYTLEEGLWLRMYKKASGVKTVTYAQALDEALCYGWIDGQMRSYDELSYIQKFTPRRSKSMWSKKNRDNVERLIAAGKMRQPGLDQINAAKTDGRWDAAYDAPSTMTVPPDFASALDRSSKAKEFFATLNKSNTYAILWRIATAKKSETRTKRIQDCIKKLENEEKFHP